MCVALTIPIGNINAAAQEPLRPIVIVTDSALPQGCHLRQHMSFSGDDKTRVTITSFAMPDNPWSGSDVRVISNILKLVDPPMQVPDAPLPSARVVESLWLTRAREISDAAAAIYDSGGGLISVYALRYRSVGDIESVKSTSGATDEFRMRLVRIVVLGDGSACSDVVVGHARSALSSLASR